MCLMELFYLSFQNGEKLFLHTKIATAILYDGYIHSWFMEISSTKTSELFKRIGNDKQKHCESQLTASYDYPHLIYNLNEYICIIE